MLGRVAVDVRACLRLFNLKEKLKIDLKDKQKTIDFT